MAQDSDSTTQNFNSINSATTSYSSSSPSSSSSSSSSSLFSVRNVSISVVVLGIIGYFVFGRQNNDLWVFIIFLPLHEFLDWVLWSHFSVSVFLSVCLSVRLSVYPSVCLSVWGDNLAEWLRRLTWVQKVPGSSPGSDIWCSCLNLLRGGAVAMVTELALNLLWKHRKWKQKARFLLVIA